MPRLTMKTAVILIPIAEDIFEAGKLVKHFRLMIQ